jgi:hypothetical protein
MHSIQHVRVTSSIETEKKKKVKELEILFISRLFLFYLYNVVFSLAFLINTLLQSYESKLLFFFCLL